MQTADREEFEIQLQKLCAAFNVPCTEARIDAYWSGFSRLSLGQFARLVDQALGDEGPKKFPTVADLWELHKKARSSVTIAQSQTPKEDPDHLEYFANRLLKFHVFDRGGLGSTGRFVAGYGMADCKPSAHLTAALDAKRELVEDFVGFIREGDEMATPREFIRRWVHALKAITPITAKTLNTYRALAQAPQSRTPFAPSMARDLKSLETEPVDPRSPPCPPSLRNAT